MLFYLPVELLLHVGSCASREDLISFATTCKGIRKVFMMQLFGGTVYIRSPLPDVPDIFDLFTFLHQGMPGLQKCTDQVAFYRQQSDLARSVHTVQMTNWIVPSPQRYLSTASDVAAAEPEFQFLLEEFQSNQYYPNALMQLCSVYESIVVNLVQCLPFSKLRLIRTHVTPIMHRTLHRMTLQSLALEDCMFEAVDFSAHVGHIGRYRSFKATSGESDHPSWNGNGLYTRGTFIRIYLFWGCSTLTKLEICIEFLRHDALDHLSLPSLTSLAIVPYAQTVGRMWSWRTVYLILKISPNITCFRFEPLHQPTKGPYPFAETTNWTQYRRDIGNLPLSQLSSITGYRELVKHLIPGRPVNFVHILLFPDAMGSEINWPQPEPDEEELHYFRNATIAPYQLELSTTPIKTLYLQRIDEQEELKYGVLWTYDMGNLGDVCPYVTDLWIPAFTFSSQRRHCRDPVDMEKLLVRLGYDWSWSHLERCAISSCSPWVAKELEWYREGTILPRRVHPTLEELLLGVSVLWKWQDDSEVTGWVLYVSTDIEGSESSEEAIYLPGSGYNLAREPNSDEDSEIRESGSDKDSEIRESDSDEDFEIRESDSDEDSEISLSSVQ